MADGAPEQSGTVELLKPEDLAQYPEFAEIKAKVWELQFEWNDQCIVRRRFQPGDIICREGEYHYTAFFILSGKVKMSLNAPIAHVTTHNIATEKKDIGRVSGLTMTMGGMSMKSMLLPSGPNISSRTFIPIDGPVDLALDNPTDTIEAGGLFGEMSCLSFYPRSATVEAIEECVMLEMQRNVLELMIDPKKGSKKFKAISDKSYRDKALRTHFHSIPEFSEVTDDYLEELKGKVELVRFEPGDVILKEGDASDKFYLVRIGFVSVGKKYPGGDMILSYLSRGHFFGEVSLLSAETSPETYTALDHVEVVVIEKAEFERMVTRFSGIRRKLKEKAKTRLASTITATPGTMEIRIDSLLRQGLMNAQNVLMIDLDSCTRCDECVHACADAHDGVTRLFRDGLRYESFLVATSCRQCTDPMCMIGCPVGSIRRRETLEVVIEDWCIGCEKCVTNCPYGNITTHLFDAEQVARVYAGQVMLDEHGKKIKAEAAEEGKPPPPKKKAYVKKATTCDLCLDLPEPSCVYACPHDAAVRGEPLKIIQRKDALRRGTPVRASVAATPKKPWFTWTWGTKKPADVPKSTPTVAPGAMKEPGEQTAPTPQVPVSERWRKLATKKRDQQ